MNLIRKGIVCSIDGGRVKVLFEDIKCVSAELLIAKGIGNLMVGDRVIVAFWKDNLIDGVVIASM